MTNDKLAVAMLRRYTSNDGVVTRKRQEQPLDAILHTISRTKELGIDIDILLAPEWFIHKGYVYGDTVRDRYTAVNETFNEEEFSNIKEKITKASLQTPETLIIPGSISWRDINNVYRNTALIVCNGSAWPYSKRDLGGDPKKGSSYDARLAHFHNSRMKPGIENGTIVWRDLTIKVGVEIGLDHKYNDPEYHEEEKQGVLKRNGYSDLDIQILITSDSPPCRESLVVRDKGLVLVSDGGTTAYSTGIIRVEQPSAADLEKTAALIAQANSFLEENTDPEPKPFGLPAWESEARSLVAGLEKFQQEGMPIMRKIDHVNAIDHTEEMTTWFEELREFEIFADLFYAPFER